MQLRQTKIWNLTGFFFAQCVKFKGLTEGEWLKCKKCNTCRIHYILLVAIATMYFQRMYFHVTRFSLVELHQAYNLEHVTRFTLQVIDDKFNIQKHFKCKIFWISKISEITMRNPRFLEKWIQIGLHLFSVGFCFLVWFLFPIKPYNVAGHILCLP